MHKDRKNRQELGSDFGEWRREFFPNAATQASFGELIGLSQDQISRYDNGQSKPNFRKLRAVIKQSEADLSRVKHSPSVCSEIDRDKLSRAKEALGAIESDWNKCQRPRPNQRRPSKSDLGRLVFIEKQSLSGQVDKIKSLWATSGQLFGVDANGPHWLVARAAYRTARLDTQVASLRDSLMKRFAETRSKVKLWEEIVNHSPPSLEDRGLKKGLTSIQELLDSDCHLQEFEKLREHCRKFYNSLPPEMVETLDHGCESEQPEKIHELVSYFDDRKLDFSAGFDSSCRHPSTRANKFYKSLVSTIDSHDACAALFKLLGSQEELALKQTIFRRFQSL